jgi:hypothetical protein
MSAFFADVDEAQHFTKSSNSLPTLRAPEITVLTKHERKQIAAITIEIEKLKSQQQKSDARKIAELEKQREAIRKSARMTMITVSIKPRIIRVLPRGNWLDDSGPIVEPAVPVSLGSLKLGNRRATRLDLANWLTDSSRGVGGLTARVFVNRFWYLLFGTGISRTLDDFGGQGEPPVHPELLDNLAVEFVESRWNIKHMIKLIVMSRAYRQSSLASLELRERDPFNRLITRQSRFRLPAEMVRDNALAISGLLVSDFGGGSIKPYQPTGYYRHLNFPTRKYKNHTDKRQWRRGVYIHWQRQFLHPMLKALDAPSREECTVDRPRSNTPLAALALLNDPTFVEAARAFAARILRTGGNTNRAKLEFAYRTAVSRAPDKHEQQLLLKLLTASLRQYQANSTAAQELITTGLAPVAKDLDTAEVAAWTTVARAILNMHETMTRN